MWEIGFGARGGRLCVQLARFGAALAAGADEVALVGSPCRAREAVPLIAFMYGYAARVRPARAVTIVPREGDAALAGDEEEVAAEAADAEARDVVCIGGTFDHMHAGHRLLVTAAAMLARKTLIVGVNMALARKQHVELIQPLHERVAAVVELVYRVNREVQVLLQPITDPAGPAATYPKIDVLVLSQETMNGGVYVNNIREKNGLPKTEFFVIPLVNDERGVRVNSSDIREKIVESAGEEKRKTGDGKQ